MKAVKPVGTRRLTQIGTTALHWTELGSGFPVVLLHGLSDSHQTWRRVAPTLAASGRRVLQVDLPGHGLSDRPDASYALDWHADVIGAWIDSLGLESFDLVGHSFGGGVAQALLLSHGARVRHLALVASGGLGREVAVALRLLSLPGVERVVEPCLQIGTRFALAVAGSRIGDAEDRRWHAWANGAPGTARALARTVRAAVDLRGQMLGLEDRADDIGELPPTALFWGDRDPILPFSHAERTAARHPEIALKRFPACGHFPHLEAPERFCDALCDFLDTEATAGALARAPAPLGARLSDLRLRLALAFRTLFAHLARGGRRVLPPRWRRGAGRSSSQSTRRALGPPPRS